MLHYSTPRLIFYRREIRDILVAHRPQAQHITQESLPSLGIKWQSLWKTILAHFFDKSIETKTDAETLEDLVRVAADIRNAMHSNSDASGSSSASCAWASKVVSKVGLIGKLPLACGTFTAISHSFWKGYSIKITAVALPSATNLPKLDIGLAATFRRLSIPTTHPVVRACGGKPKAERKFAEFQRQKTHVHAEMQLVFHMATEGIAGVHPYIGTSKLPCVLCAEFLKMDGTFSSQKSHEHLYTKWTMPRIDRLPPQGQERMRTIIEGMKRALRGR